MHRVLFVGFSVTEERGYVPALKEISESHGFQIDSKAIGGAALWSIPYFTDILRYGDYQICIFEIATCLRYAEDNPAVYLEALEASTHACLSAGCSPAFLNLYRGDVDYDRDRLRPTVRDFCATNGIPCLDLVDEMIGLRKEDRLMQYLRDTTHTTGVGAAFYAQNIMPFLVEISHSPVNEVHFKAPPVQKSILPLSSFVQSGEERSFERGGISVAYIELAEEQRLSLKMPDGWSYDGMLFLRGPCVGTFEIGLGSLGYFKLHAFDAHSYYRRISCWRPPKSGASEVLIRQLAGTPNVAPLKGEKYLGPRVGEVGPILVSRPD